MTLRDRHPAVLAALIVLASFVLPVSVAPAFASAAPPFCVMRGGANGDGGSPQICSYADYQACLLAAAELHGNCVQNIDYHGEVSTAPAPARPRHRR
jgi:Protein of unknown function (DUF3551)